MDLRLGGTPVLITGGSRGIGRAIAIGFAREGAKVAICGRDADSLAVTAEAVRGAGAECVVIQADLMHAEECQLVVDETARRFGGLQVLVNNASTTVDTTPASLENATDSQIFERLSGKTMAAIRCSRASIPHMKKLGEGRIIHIGGTSARSMFRRGELPTNGSSLPQGLGNAAMANFSKYLSEELVGSKILVNVVHPHIIRTDRHASRVLGKARELGLTEAEAEAVIDAQIPLGRVIEVDDVCPLVLFLSSSLAGAITGQAIAVDGGASRSIMY